MSIAAFDQVSLHQTIDQDGKSRMAVADAVSIPAGGELEFKPGSYHAMLEKPTQALAVGKEVAADFAFQSGETAKALCEVKPANALSKKYILWRPVLRWCEQRSAERRVGKGCVST